MWAEECRKWQFYLLLSHSLCKSLHPGSSFNDQMVTKTAIHLFELSSSNTPFGVAKMLLCCKPCWFLDLPVVMELSFKMTAISVEYGRTLSNATHGNRTLPVSQELVSGTLSGCCFESLKPAIFEEKFSPSHSFSEIQWWCPPLGSTTKRYKIYFSKELSFKGNILLCLTLEVQHFFKKKQQPSLSLLTLLILPHTLLFVFRFHELYYIGVLLVLLSTFVRLNL